MRIVSKDWCVVVCTLSYMLKAPAQVLAGGACGVGVVCDSHLVLHIDLNKGEINTFGGVYGFE